MDQQKQKLLNAGVPVMFTADELSNGEYHGNRTHVSSSALKTVLKDPAEYERKYLKGEKDKPTEAMEFGTYVHTLILEPHLASQECAVYPGLRRVGKAWEEFKAANRRKLIVTQPEHDKAMLMASNFWLLDAAKPLMEGGTAENSYFARLEGVPVKVRLDMLSAAGQIVDIKTTSRELDENEIGWAILRFGYDMSAALYVDLLKQFTGVEHPYYLAFLSKAGSCQAGIWKVSDEMLAIGRKKYRKALKQLTICRESGIWTADPILNLPEINYPKEKEA